MRNYFWLAILFAFIHSIDLNAESIYVETAGTLKVLVGDKQATITELVLSGYINETDIACIREMPVLKILDMKQSIITEKDKDTSIVTTITSLWSNMFAGMDVIEKIILPDNILNIGSFSFSRCKVQSVILPEGLKTIGEYSFRNAEELASIHIPSTVTSIGNSGFGGCYNLKEVTFADNSQLEIIGESAFYNTEITNIEIPETVTSLGASCFKECEALVSVNIPFRVKVIAQKMFNKCINLTEVKLPEGLETMEKGAFSECSKLSDIILPSTLVAIGDTIDSFQYDGAFYRTALKSIIIPEKVTMLGADTFDGCTHLESVTLPDGLTFLADKLFNGNSSLQIVNLPKALTMIGTYAFGGCSKLNMVLVIPEGVVDIRENAFSTCNSIPSIVLPEGLKTIGFQAFWNCFKLEKINIPSTVRSIGIRAFYGCYALSSPLIIPEGVSIIESGTFQSCKALPAVQLPNSISEIGELAFAGCTVLADIQLPIALTTIGSSAFSGCSALNSPMALPETMQTIPNSLFSDCVSLEEVRIPNTMQVIEANAFKNCQKIANIVLPDNLQTIGAYAFYGCLSLEAIKFPEKLNSIGIEAFVATKLQEVILDDKLETIEKRAFYSNDKLKYLYIPKSVTSIGAYAFENCKNLKSIIYDAEIDIPDNMAFGFALNEYKYFDNILLYLSSDAVKVPESWEKVQVIRNDEIESVTFVDSASIYIARPFKTKQISYSRDFTMESGLHNSAGWQSIVLPFTASRFTHETKGELAPFGSNTSGAKPFWLRELTSDGYVISSVLEANKPYIVSMPNNSAYEDAYNITGVVTFVAENEVGITISATPASMPIGETANYKLIPAYQTVAANDTVYALNSSAYNENLPGSAFVRNLRDVLPFEAYVVSKETRTAAPAMYSIGGTGGDITALEKILLKEANTLHIYAQGNTLYIETDKPRLISIYGADGIRVRLVSAQEGKNAVNNLPAGIYFLEGKKVIIGN